MWKKRLMKKRSRRDEAVPLEQHLKALRTLLLQVCIVFAAAFSGTFAVSKMILNWFIGVAEDSGYKLVYLSPQEVVLQQFRIAGMGGLLLGLPLIAVSLYWFIRVALSRKERVAAVLLCMAGCLCFCLGVVFACMLAYPLMLQFFYGVNSGYSIASAVSVGGFIDLAFLVFLIFGCVTELPVFCVLLALAGVMTLDRMRVAEKPVFVAAFIIGALLTPPDVVSQLLVAVPLIVLYKLSEVLVWICQKRNKRIEE